MYDIDIEHELVDYNGTDVAEYFVTALDFATGRVLRHNVTFRSHDLFIDPVSGEEVLWERPAGDAKREAEILFTAIKNKGVINHKWWEEYVPAGAEQ